LPKYRLNHHTAAFDAMINDLASTKLKLMFRSQHALFGMAIEKDFFPRPSDH
jgi:hypothetical protein